MCKAQLRIYQSVYCAGWKVPAEWRMRFESFSFTIRSKIYISMLRDIRIQKKNGLKVVALNDTDTYQRKNGSQHTMNVPIMMPKVLAALCSRFILIKCLSFVGVWSCSTSCSVNVFDEPEPLSASPAAIKANRLTWKTKRNKVKQNICSSGNIRCSFIRTRCTRSSYTKTFDSL